MSAVTATARGQRAAFRLMVDIGRIVRPGEPVYDPATRLLVETDTEVYVGPCRIRQPNGLVEAEKVFGDRQVTTSRFIAEFPHDVTEVRIDDVVIVTSSADADLLGHRFRIIGPSMGTYVLAKRFPSEVVE